MKNVVFVKSDMMMSMCMCSMRMFCRANISDVQPSKV